MRQLRSFSLFRFLVICLIAVLLTVAGIAKAQNATKPARLILRPIENREMVTLKGNVHPLATPANDHGAAPDSMPLNRMVLLLNRSTQQQQALNKMSDGLQNSKSPSYHKWLTPAEFGALYGLGDEDLSAVTSWLESNGFKIEEASPARNIITFSGTHAQLKNTFHTELHQYQVNGSLYWANATDPQIPAALAPVIRGFASLNNLPLHQQHTKPMLVRHSPSTGKWEQLSSTAKVKPQFTVPNTNLGTFFGIGPADFATIYNVQPLYTSNITGSGETIAVVEDSDINPADVDYFRSVFGLPAKNLNLIYNGPDPGFNLDEEEAAIDVEWAGGVAPGATIDMVASAGTAVTSGVNLSAIYVVENNLVPIMSVSFQNCELFLGNAGNAFYEELWRQAAAQGITVMVAAGDAGSAMCDDGAGDAEFGSTVNGIASTPYNVALGGTDLYGTALAPNTYWSANNNPTNLESALSYMPETPWNDTCANPQGLPFFQAQGFPDATPEALCNDPNFGTEVVGGGGGASSCTIGAPQNSPNAGNPASCILGYTKPSWQSGVPGIPADGARDVPDISLMAGDGFYGSAYVFCQSDATVLDPPNNGFSCSVNTALQAAGGTSFAAPNFAGILALVEQQTQSRQGNINYVLYKLGTAEFADNGALGQACQSSSVIAGNACTFYDISLGTNAMPCATGSLDCTTMLNVDQIGIMNGFSAEAGYDQASGIGTVNAYNLVQNWSSVTGNLLPSVTTLSASGSTSIAYGSPLGVNVSVAAVAAGSGTPTGDVGVVSNSTMPGQQGLTDTALNNGQASIALQQLPVGSYQVSVNYTGDATFASSTSNGVAVTVAQAASTALIYASQSTAMPGQQLSLFMTVNAQGSGVDPTGTVTFTDATTGQALGTSTVAGVAAGGPPTANGYVTLPSGMLGAGANTITATYSGDGNYQGSTASSIVVTIAGPFAVGVNPGSLNMTAGSTTGNSITVSAMPNGNATLNPGTLKFACQGTLAPGLACSFSTPVAQANGSVSSTLTLQITSPMFVKNQGSASASNSRRASESPMNYGVPAAAGLFIFLVAKRRRRFASYSGALVLLLASGLMLSGCGGAGKAPVPISTVTPSSTTTSLQASSLSPAMNSAVTFNATVASATGSRMPTGSVAFMSGATTLGTAQLANGTASFTTSTLPIGSQSITAQYEGNTTDSASTSIATTVDVTFSTIIAITVQDNAGNIGSVNLPITID